ncbi:hypothetical protein NMY22_g4031 [Coprinellus aureogranulatus]|nr:hypothetical protein NMY22_g4031 [Coprinellus aureogranulatus]
MSGLEETSTASPDLKIPGELWLKTAIVSNAVDVVALQLTCKFLYNLLRSKSVWTSVLRRSCFENGVFFPSFPVEEMDVTRLQRAAISPDQFDDSPQLELLASSLVRSNLESDYLLVPGGRFILVGNRAELCLWDCGPPDSARRRKAERISFQSIAKHAGVHDTPAHMIQMAVRIVEDSLRVAIVTDSLAVNVYDINPCAPAPSFKPLGTFLLDARETVLGLPRCTNITLSDDLIIIGTQGGVKYSVVWNFKDGWYALGPNDSEISYGYAKTIQEKNVILECDGDQLIVWSAAVKDLPTYPVVSGKLVSLLDPNTHSHATGYTSFKLPNRPPPPTIPPGETTLLQVSFTGGPTYCDDCKEEHIKLGVIFRDTVPGVRVGSTAIQQTEAIRAYCYHLTLLKRQEGETHFNIKLRCQILDVDSKMFDGMIPIGSLYI